VIKPWSPTDKELLEYADQHLTYEIKMLRWTTSAILAITPVKTNNALSYVCNCALVTSYTLHARNLIDFLYPPKKRRPTDIVVQHYIDDTILSDTGRFPPITSTLRKAKEKADKQAAHLTYDRIDKYIGVAKAWPISQITRDITSAVLAITPCFPSTKMSNMFREFLSQLHCNMPLVTAIPFNGEQTGIGLGTISGAQF
jgi:hypothetical protein